MTSRSRLRALERRHQEAARRGPCPACPPPRTVYQDDDGRPLGPFGAELPEGTPPRPPLASCPACGHPEELLVVTYTRNWRGGQDTRLGWSGDGSCNAADRLAPSAFRAARPEELPPGTT